MRQFEGRKESFLCSGSDSILLSLTLCHYLLLSPESSRSIVSPAPHTVKGTSTDRLSAGILSIRSLRALAGKDKPGTALGKAAGFCSMFRCELAARPALSIISSAHRREAPSQLWSLIARQLRRVPFFSSDMLGMPGLILPYLRISANRRCITPPPRCSAGMMWQVH